jgi:hypothetical protein
MYLMRRYALKVGVCAAAIAVASGALGAWATYGRWAVTPVVFYVNPTNADVTTSAAEAALQAAMDIWNRQQPTSFRFFYGGRVSDTTTGYDGRNVVIFRNASDGGALATTYSWSNGGYITDTDIVFWDGAYTFFVSTGCSGGMYIEDVGAHEFGHAAGLLHSSSVDATMYPVASSYCSQSWRTLAEDDVAAISSLYSGGQLSPPPSPTNTAPSVTILEPANGTSYTEGTWATFTGSASDSEDGNLTGQLTWTDNGTAFGTGGTAQRQLTGTGTHSIVAWVTDSGGLQTSRAISVSVTSTNSTSDGTSGGTSGPGNGRGNRKKSR